MKYLFLVIGLLAAVVLAALYVPVKDGKPLVEWEQVRDVASDPGRLVKEGPVGEPQDKAPELYRWRGSNGTWQYGDVPPPGVAAEPVDVKPARRLSSEAVRQGELEQRENTQ